jgi:hypothetical protein
MKERYRQRHLWHLGQPFIVRRLPRGAVIFNGKGQYLARVKCSQLKRWLDYFAKEQTNGNTQS